MLNRQDQKGIFTKGDNMFLNGKIKEILDYILQLSKIVLVITLIAFIIDNWYSIPIGHRVDASVYHKEG